MCVVHRKARGSTLGIVPKDVVKLVFWWNLVWNLPIQLSWVANKAQGAA